MEDPRRLELLVALARLGSMRAVAEAMHVTTSTVCQQLAVLAREAGTPLTEPAWGGSAAHPGRPPPGRPRGHHPGRRRGRPP